MHRPAPFWLERETIPQLINCVMPWRGIREPQISWPLTPLVQPLDKGIPQPSNFHRDRLTPELRSSAKPAVAEMADSKMPVLPSLPHDDDMGVIREAMAYRIKYRAGQNYPEYTKEGFKGGSKIKKKIPLMLLGVHPKNRGGVYPMGETVEGLGVSILTDGFNLDEANHQGVCVQQVPSSHIVSPIEQRDDSYLSYNLSNCVFSPLYCMCFNADGDVAYGTLSHSHLLLVLLCLMNGAKWALPDTKKFQDLVDAGGCFVFAAVAALDPVLASVCQEGLDMEVLSWKMHVEEPTACSLISQALNKGQQVALRTTELTALAVLTGAVTRELESAVADSVAFETVKEKVRKELDMFVDDPEFIALFEFVVSQGASKGGFVSDLIAFGSKFVNQKTRQLRLGAFAEANKLPLTAPRVKNAMIMRAYRKTPAMKYCPSPEAAWGKASRQREREERAREREDKIR